MQAVFLPTEKLINQPIAGSLKKLSIKAGIAYFLPQTGSSSLDLNKHEFGFRLLEIFNLIRISLGYEESGTCIENS